MKIYISIILSPVMKFINKYYSIRAVIYDIGKRSLHPCIQATTVINWIIENRFIFPPKGLYFSWLNHWQHPYKRTLRYIAHVHLLRTLGWCMYISSFKSPWRNVVFTFNYSRKSYLLATILNIDLIVLSFATGAKISL